MNIFLGIAWFVAMATAAATGAANGIAPCRPAYVVPYAEQCDFAFAGLKTKSSPRDLSQAFDTCGRSQDEDSSCVKVSDHELHIVALSALYRSVTLQAEIAMYARQFRVAEALLRERLDVIGIVQREARPGDPAPATERAAAERELAQSRSGECTQAALAGAGRQFALGKAHKYDELATLLKRKSDDYASCARLLSVAPDRAYVEYAGLVALEESGRAAQAAGHKDVADRTYRSCIDGARRVERDASARVKAYLTTVATLCKGREDGTYAVDRPQPLDAQDAKAFAPLTLPHP